MEWNHARHDREAPMPDEVRHDSATVEAYGRLSNSTPSDRSRPRGRYIAAPWSFRPRYAGWTHAGREALGEALRTNVELDLSASGDQPPVRPGMSNGMARGMGHDDARGGAGAAVAPEPRVDAGMKELNEMTIGRTDDPENPFGARLSKPPQCLGLDRGPHLGQRSRAASTGRTHDRNRPARQTSHLHSCIQGAVHTCTNAGKCCSHRSRRSSRIFRIDNLSPGIATPCSSAKDQNYPRLKTVSGSRFAPSSPE